MGLDMGLIGTSKKDIKKEETLIYWRKANAIHRWFSEYIIDKYNLETNEIESCKEYPIDKEALTILLANCKLVLDDHNLAETILPTQDGFFFGTTEYDEYYFEDIRYTVSYLDTILKVLSLTESDDIELSYVAWW